MEKQTVISQDFIIIFSFKLSSKTIYFKFLNDIMFFNVDRDKDKLNVYEYVTIYLKFLAIH